MPIIQLEKESLDVVQGSKKVNINRFASGFSGVDTLGELQLMNIFSHFEPEAKENAEAELFGAMPLGGQGSVELVVAHTNGADTFKCGIFSTVDSFTGSSVVGGSLVLTPENSNWKSFPWPAKGIKLRAKTNIVDGDCFDELMGSRIQVQLIVASKTGPSSSTIGTRASLTYDSSGPADGVGGKVVSGTTNSPAIIGTTGTYFSEVDISVADPRIELGVDGSVGSHFIFGIYIPSSADTKTYRFRVEVEYE
ncbi:MAG: hypothetical protein E6Q68_01665 [Polynucleobacter sp.]|nr:MAG: hypothetical protein E6Q68_01665 [Polynucleobacter sp.]